MRGPGAAGSPVMSRAVSSSGDIALTDMLQKELEYEKGLYQAPPELQSAPAGWQLKETAGDTHMTLTKTERGETVQVDVMVNEQPENDEDEGMVEDEEEAAEGGALDVDVGVVFNVSVTKGDTALVFECRSDGTYLDIQHCSLEPADGEVPDSSYTGPVYEELDEDLQAKFQHYLEERGVGPALGAFILQLVHDKEQREYMSWLAKVKDFVAAK